MQPTDTSLDTAAEHYERNAVLAGVAVAVVVGVALMLVSIWLGLAIAVLASLAWAGFVRSRVSGTPARLIAATGARRVAEGEFPRLDNLLDGLGVTSGVAGVDSWVIDSPSMNAATVAGRDGADLIVTTGLVEGLGRLELEGVLANMLGRVRDGSARYCTVAIALSSPDRARRSLESRLGEQRQILTDLAAVDVTRYPPGLSAALAVMARSGTALEVPDGSEALWLASPTGDEAEQAPLSLRVAVLDEL